MKSTAEAGNSAKRIRYNDTSVQPQSERDKQSANCDAVAGNGSSPKYKEGEIPMEQYILPSVSHSELLNVRNQQITISYLLICAIEDKHIRRCADMAVDNKQRCEYLRMFRKYPELLRIEQLCEALGGISTKTGYKLLRERRINSLKVGREYRVTKVDLINYLMK